MIATIYSLNRSFRNRFTAVELSVETKIYNPESSSSNGSYVVVGKVASWPPILIRISLIENTLTPSFALI
jgi:hypothetical protein